MVNVNARPAECTCPSTPGVPDGTHTSSVASSISDETLRVLIGMETCPVEARALERILNARHRHMERV